MSQSHRFFLDLSDHELLRVLSYLWFQDVCRVKRVNMRLNRLLNHDEVLMCDLFCKQLSLNGSKEPYYTSSFVGKQIMKLSSRLTIWPNDIDTAELKHNLIEIQIPGQTSKCVTYAGATLGKNRSFVANNHFPVLGELGSLQSISSFPFTKVVYDAKLHCSVPIISGIAYYEITIHRQIPVAGVISNDAFAPCVAIGIANHLHRMNKMPGWDSNSYAFHGDDGMFFHRWEDEGVQFTGDQESAQFGQGDTVGFGIIYSKLGRRNTEFFLTKNGEYVGKLYETNANFEACTWFPCVGTDAHCPIEMNFGNKGVSFMFDVVAFENETNEHHRLHHGRDLLALDSLPLLPEVPSVTFRAPYHGCNHFEGGLFRDRQFMKQVREHVTNNATSSRECSQSGEDNDASEWETIDNDNSDGGSDDGSDGDDEGGVSGMALYGTNGVSGSEGSESSGSEGSGSEGSGSEGSEGSEGSSGSGSEDDEDSDELHGDDADSSDAGDSLGSESTATLLPGEHGDADDYY